MDSGEITALPGCYLLVVLGEPICDSHNEKILQKVGQGLLSWNTETTQCDLENLERVCDDLKGSKHTTHETELLLQHATDKLAVEVLFNPQIFTLKQCLRNLLLSPTGHKHMIFAGYSFNGSGSWILQDGIFRFNDFMDELSDPNVIKVLSQNTTGHSVKMHLHCAPIGDWIINNLEDQSFSHLLSLSLNPPESPNGVPGASHLLEFIETSLATLAKESNLESSTLVGNIKFERPTMYIFPSGQGDCSLLGITGFTMLIDGGFPRFPCFWKFIRHIERIDSILITRVNESNVWGILSLMKGKQECSMFPKIGYVFCNMGDKKSCEGDGKSTNGFRENGRLQSIRSDPNDLIISLVDMGNEIATRMECIGCNPHRCLRETPPNPLTLYQKLGHGTLEMYVLSPPKDSRLLKEFLSLWHSGKDHLPVVRTRSALKKNGQSGQDIAVPIADVMSICCLIIWRPFDPSDQITRILFPGSAPQSQVMEGLAMLKGLDLLTTRVCSRSSLETQKQKKTATKPSSVDKTENGSGSSTRYRSVSPTMRKSRTSYAKQTSVDAVVKNEDSSESQSSPIKRKVNASLAQKADHSSKISTKDAMKKTISTEKKNQRDTHKRGAMSRNATPNCLSEIKSSETTSETLEGRLYPLQPKQVHSRVSNKQPAIKKSEKVIEDTKTKIKGDGNGKSENTDDCAATGKTETCEDASPRKLPFLDLLRDEVEPDSLEYYDFSANVEISQDSLEHSEDGVMTSDSHSTSQLDHHLQREYDDTTVKGSPSPTQCEPELQSEMMSSHSSNLSEKTIISGDRNDESASDFEVASLTMQIEGQKKSLSFGNPIDEVNNDELHGTEDTISILRPKTRDNHPVGKDQSIASISNLQETESEESVTTELQTMTLNYDSSASAKSDTRGEGHSASDGSIDSALDTINEKNDVLQQEVDRSLESTKKENTISHHTDDDAFETENERKGLMEDQSATAITRSVNATHSEVATEEHSPLVENIEKKELDTVNSGTQAYSDKDSENDEPKIPENKLTQVQEDIKRTSIDLTSADTDAYSDEMVIESNGSLHEKELFVTKEEYHPIGIMEKSTKDQEENETEIKADEGEVGNAKISGTEIDVKLQIESTIEKIDAETKSISIDKKTTSDASFVDESEKFLCDEMVESSLANLSVTKTNSILDETSVTTLRQTEVEPKKSLAGEAVAESKGDCIVAGLPEAKSSTTEETKTCTEMSEKDTTTHIPNDTTTTETDTTELKATVEADAVSIMVCETDEGDANRTTIIVTKEMNVSKVTEADNQMSSQKIITGTEQKETIQESVQTSHTDNQIEGRHHIDIEDTVTSSSEIVQAGSALDTKIDERAETSRQSNSDSTSKIHDFSLPEFSHKILSSNQNLIHPDADADGSSKNPDSVNAIDNENSDEVLLNEVKVTAFIPTISPINFVANYEKRDFVCDQNANQMRHDTEDFVSSIDRKVEITSSSQGLTDVLNNSTLPFSDVKHEFESGYLEKNGNADIEGGSVIQSRHGKTEANELFDDEKIEPLYHLKGRIGLSHEMVRTKEYPEVLHIKEGSTPTSPEDISNEATHPSMIIETASSSMTFTSNHDTESTLCCFPKVDELEEKRKEEKLSKKLNQPQLSDAFKSENLTEQQIKHKEDTLKEWGNPLGLPKPPAHSDKAPKSRAKSSERTEYLRHSNRRSGACDLPKPVYLDLAYIPNHGDRHYCNAEYFKRIRARYYVLSGVNPSKEVLDALIVGKQSWKDGDVETTLIPSHESETLCLWMATNQKTLELLNIEVAPSASRCSVILQGQDSSCSAYRVEF